jgi:hypothetical protein
VLTIELCGLLCLTRYHVQELKEMIRPYAVTVMINQQNAKYTDDLLAVAEGKVGVGKVMLVM